MSKLQHEKLKSFLPPVSILGNPLHPAKLLTIWEYRSTPHGKSFCKAFFVQLRDLMTLRQHVTQEVVVKAVVGLTVVILCSGVFQDLMLGSSPTQPDIHR